MAESFKGFNVCNMTKSRCSWAKETNPLYIDYHDNEWGVPTYDDQMLFEMLVLEGCQAGLSWETILNKREGYRRAFHNFDVNRVASMTDEELEQLRDNSEIVRNRLKINMARKNARVFLDIKHEFGSFKDYLWAYVDHQPIQNHWETMGDVPASTPLSDKISKDLKKRGMSFVGTTIIYAYMQACGLVNDHITSCFCYDKV